MQIVKIKMKALRKKNLKRLLDTVDIAYIDTFDDGTLFVYIGDWSLAAIVSRTSLLHSMGCNTIKIETDIIKLII